MSTDAPEIEYNSEVTDTDYPQILLDITPLTTTQYVTNWIAFELALMWYFFFSVKSVCRTTRFFVKNGFTGFYEFMRSGTSPAPSPNPVRASEAPHNPPSSTSWQLPAVGSWGRMAAISSFLLFPFFLVTLPYDPNTKLAGADAMEMKMEGEGEEVVGLFEATVLMVWFMCVPTLLCTVRFPNRDNLDLLNDVLFIFSLLVPWMLGWLPTATCSLSKDTSIPISHIVILNLTIFLVHVPSRLHHRMGFNFFSIFKVSKLIYAMVGFLFCFVIVMPLGVFSGFLAPVLNDQEILFEYLSYFALQYFLYSMILEIFFRGIVQNLIEFHLEKRYPDNTSTSENKDNIIHLQAFAPLSEDAQASDYLTDLDDLHEPNLPSPSFGTKMGEFIRLNRNAAIALFATAFINGICFLFSSFCQGVGTEKDDGLNYMYGLLSFLTAIAYGWVWRKTTRVTVSALTHAMVNFMWFYLFPCGFDADE